ncbi:MAG: hypothetical protein ABIH25_05445 [Candidatus Woesearchaeota archaeon]
MGIKKWQRRSGYKISESIFPKKLLDQENIIINPFYDDWINWRDGFRDWFRDSKIIKRINRSVKFFNNELYEKRIKMNIKQKKLQERRKARKLIGDNRFDI